MKPREKKMLIGGFAGLLALWQGWALLDGFVLQPVRDREDDITAREERVALKTKKLKESRAAARQLDEWKVRSLPPDPRIATAMYQNWLNVLTKKTLTNATVTANFRDANKAKGDVYQRISESIAAQGTLSQLCDFLYEFRQSGLLHRVSRMNLKTEQHKGKPVFDITLTVEGLSLKDSLARTTSLADPKLADLVTAKPGKERKAYEPIVAQNLFVRGYNGPQPTKQSDRGIPKPIATIPEEDPRNFVFLVGSVSSDGDFSAMLFDRSTGKDSRLTEGAKFVVAGVTGQVVSIGSDFITFTSKGAAWRLELGKNLADMKKSGSSADSSTTEADSSSAETEADEPAYRGRRVGVLTTPEPKRATPQPDADEVTALSRPAATKKRKI